MAGINLVLHPLSGIGQPLEKDEIGLQEKETRYSEKRLESSAMAVEMEITFDICHSSRNLQIQVKK